MKILLSGSHGLIGTATRNYLQEQGHRVSALARSKAKMLPGDIFWNPTRGEIDVDHLEGFDAVIHLAGENIATGRWTPEKKQKIRESRTDGTRILSQAIANLKRKPSVFVSASAIGYYGDRGEELLTERSPAGRGFLPDVCTSWELATSAASQAGVRVVNLRIGIVLTPLGGALKKLLPPFRLGLGGRTGSGKQYMSWVSLEEVVRMIEFSLRQQTLEGPVNAVSPYPVRNQEFTRTLAKVFRRPAWIPFPAFAAKTLLGEMAQDLLLASIRVEPTQLLAHGYEFRHHELQSTLHQLLSPVKQGEQTFTTECWIPAPREQVFRFFCDPKNLERITPPWLNFKIDHQSTPEIREGTEFSYRLKIRGLPLRWRSRIEKWDPDSQFSDIQLSGPYAKWHHTHRFLEQGGGTLMTDEVLYALPGGMVGNLVGGTWIRKDVEQIFDYRKETITHQFFPPKRK